MPDSSPRIDELLFEALRTHSLRTRGHHPARVTVRYADGSETTLPVPAPESPATVAPGPSWPPAEGWAFRPGEAAFNGQRVKVAGKVLAILRTLAERPGEPVTGDRLKRVVWGEEPELVEDGNLQGHVSLLRKRLKDALGLGEVNPVTHADGAYRLAVY